MHAFLWPSDFSKTIFLDASLFTLLKNIPFCTTRRLVEYLENGLIDSSHLVMIKINVLNYEQILALKIKSKITLLKPILVDV